MSIPEDRYNKIHEYKGIKFHLSGYTPNYEECKIVILKIIEQASRDYLTLYNAKSPTLQYLWETARQFIFDDNYLIDWGNKTITPSNLLDIVDINIQWLRRKMQERFSKIERESDG